MRALLALPLLVACPATVEWEGDEAGECADDADNDRDGAFDCDDPDCAGAAACDEGDDSGPDDDSVGDDDTSDDDTSSDDDSVVSDDDSVGDDDTGDDDTQGDDDSAAVAWDQPFFAPYVDATAWPTPRVGDIALESGVRQFVLAFIVAGSPTSCDATWGTYFPIETGPSSWDSAEGGEHYLYDEIDELQTLGGDVMVSFGGAANTPIEVPCAGTNAIVEQYLRVIDTLALAAIDMDIEGIWLADHGPGGSVGKRSVALAALQDQLVQEGRDVALWYTLPVLPQGLTLDGLTVVDDAITQGVELAGINVMLMNYGDSPAPNPDGLMGQYAIDALTELKVQLDTLYSSHGIVKSDGELWAMIGGTPMIGLNDVTTERFTLADAEQVRAFADGEGVRMLSMWSTNRDHPCPGETTVRIDCSSTADQVADWAFSGIFGANRGD